VGQEKVRVEIDDDEAEVVWQEATQPSGPPITFKPEAHIAHLVETAAKLVPYILGRPWTLVRFQRRSLATCDSPVGLVRRPEDEPWQGVGFLTALAITFPLTRKLGLIMGDITPLAEANIPVQRVPSGEGDGVEEGTTALETFINDSTVGSASEYVYHHPDDGSVLPSPLPEPTLTTFSVPGQEEAES
jgi:hypothetical protein